MIQPGVVTSGRATSHAATRRQSILRLLRQYPEVVLTCIAFLKTKGAKPGGSRTQPLQ